MFGMRRALFSSEAGLGTAPIAHAAVKTSEPVTEGVVAGLEPLIDTLFVCTITGLVILCSGLWNRGPSLQFDRPPSIVKVAPGQWAPQQVVIQGTKQLKAGAPVFMVLTTPEGRVRSYGTLETAPEIASDALRVTFGVVASITRPDVAEKGLFADYRGATLVAKSFDSVHDGFGRWLVTIAVWVFSLSTLISYGYYAEQAVVYLGGSQHLLALRVLWCAAAALACAGWLKTSGQLDAISTVGMGFMYAINVPMMLFLSARAMRAWHDYFRRRAIALGQT